MANTVELIDEVLSLPVEDRALIADSLLQSLNAPQAEIDREWIAVAKRRMEELRTGKVEGIPGEEVFARIRRRFAK